MLYNYMLFNRLNVILTEYVGFDTGLGVEELWGKGHYPSS